MPFVTLTTKDGNNIEVHVDRVSSLRKIFLRNHPTDLTEVTFTDGHTVVVTESKKEVEHLMVKAEASQPLQVVLSDKQMDILAAKITERLASWQAVASPAETATGVPDRIVVRRDECFRVYINDCYLSGGGSRERCLEIFNGIVDFFKANGYKVSGVGLVYPDGWGTILVRNK